MLWSPTLFVLLQHLSDPKTTLAKHLRQGWTKMTNFADLDAMDDEDWDKVSSFLSLYLNSLLRGQPVLECQRQKQLPLVQGCFTHI